MCLGEFQSRLTGCSNREGLLWSLIKNCELYIHHALVSGSLKSPHQFYASSSFLPLFVSANLLLRFLTVMKVFFTSYHCWEKPVWEWGWMSAVHLWSCCYFALLLKNIARTESNQDSLLSTCASQVSSKDFQLLYLIYLFNSCGSLGAPGFWNVFSFWILLSLLLFYKKSILSKHKVSADFFAEISWRS